ncbi:MAG: metallophosphoesterase [Proteobacteria bacterium]|nr:metallophosphoesterase [Pseudomonadota bacterium]
MRDRVPKLIFLLLLAAVSANAEEWRVDGVDRVVAIADVHGAYDAMVGTLQNAGILDDGFRWAGGAAHLVIVGDILDRGPRSRDAMDLLMRLEGEAQAAGGFVHVLIGNHESMNMIGDLRYVSKGEYGAFAADESDEQRRRWFRAYQRRQPPAQDAALMREKFDDAFPPGYFALRQAFGASGKYGQWLLSKPVIAVINETAFVHGGLSPVVTEYGLDGVNTDLKAELVDYVRALEVLIEAEVVLPTDNSYDFVDIVSRYSPRRNAAPGLLAAIETVKALDRSSMVSTDGPLWYRANVACGGVIERNRLDESLAAIGAKRVVIGHTPTPTRRVLQRFEGRVVEIDTGMLSTHYKGSGNALVLAGDAIAVHNQSGATPYTPVPHPRGVGVRPHDMGPDELATLLRDGEIVARNTEDGTRRTVVTVNDGDHVVNAIFTRRKGKGFYPDVAAYRLDRLLELDMVPVAVVREVDGRDGSLQFYPAKVSNEEARRASGRGAGAMCPLPDQWEAMYVFDTLIYNEGRSERRMLYNTRNWGLMLVGHERAFRSRNGRPPHLENVSFGISDGWRTALESLTDDVLAANLGDVLDGRRLRLLGSRRDELLAAPIAGRAARR